MNSPDYLELTLIPTSRCSLRCDYCVVLDSLGYQDAKVEDAIKFLDWQLNLEKNLNKNVMIEFFGAEPTMNWQYVKFIIFYVKATYKSKGRNISFRIYTNGLWSETIKEDLEIWKEFDDIIVSIDGQYEDNLSRTKSKELYRRSIDNLKYLIANDCAAGVAFVLHPTSNLERVFKTFTDIGCRYFHFEIASLWNDDKDNKINNKFLLKVFQFIYDNILIWNIHHKNEYRLFSIPKEFLASHNYFNKEKHYSCFETSRALSLKGNIYACRDLAIGENHLEESSTNDNVFFKSNTVKPFNIVNLQLNNLTDQYASFATDFDSVTPCWVKAFEFKHLAGIQPEWLEDKDFQDIIIYPMFELMNNTFSIYHKNLINDETFMSFYSDRILFYGKLLEIYNDKY